jgi:hypothetical protein
MRADFEAIVREAGTGSDLDEVLAIIVRRVRASPIAHATPYPPAPPEPGAERYDTFYRHAVDP